jgi:hypothetical protein
MAPAAGARSPGRHKRRIRAGRRPGAAMGDRRDKFNPTSRQKQFAGHGRFLPHDLQDGGTKRARQPQSLRAGARVCCRCSGRSAGANCSLAIVKGFPV